MGRMRVNINNQDVVNDEHDNSYLSSGGGGI